MNYRVIYPCTATILLAALCCLAQPAPDFTSRGPCVATAWRQALQLPAVSGCGRDCSIDLHIHLPACPQPCTACPAAPYPVVVFFCGFQLRTEYYVPYAERLTTWGYVVVQYNLAFLDMVQDSTEVGYLQYIMAQLQLDVYDAASPLFGMLDLQQLATAGHSRGGKLAALHLAENPAVRTAYLIDPVDSHTAAAQESGQYLSTSSAVGALRGLNKVAAITGAGVHGQCNPLDSNYTHFWEVLGPGSWLEVVPQAGHMQFTNISAGMVAHFLDWLCRRGSITHPRAISLTAAPLVAWMEHTFRRKGCTDMPGNDLKLCCFFDWVRHEEAAGEITWAVKDNQTVQLPPNS